MYRRFLIPIAAAALLSGGGCSKDPAGPVEFPFSSPDLIAERADVSGCQIGLDCFLWRDFMPSTYPVSDSRMIAAVTVFETGGRALPEGLRPGYMWVFNGKGDVWGVRIGEETVPGSDLSKITAIARDGPTWETGTRADVVVSLDTGEGKIYLRQPDVLIIRTE